MTVPVQRASQRFVTQRDGWVGHYCFSYDEHYDPRNVSFGRMLACNEFVLEPGAGFGMHRHAGVDIVTSVLEGVLTHVTSGGSEQRTSGSYSLSTGGGLEHDERNEGGEPVRFVQAWFVPGDQDPGPVQHVLAPGDSVLLEAPAFLLVTEGAARLEETVLMVGDSARLTAPLRLSTQHPAAEGAGGASGGVLRRQAAPGEVRALVWRC